MPRLGNNKNNVGCHLDSCRSRWYLAFCSLVLCSCLMTAPDGESRCGEGNYPNLFRAGPLTRDGARCIVRGSRDERDCSLTTE